MSPDCDDTNKNITNHCYQFFYKDNDGDGWHSEIIADIVAPDGTYKTSSKGLDCDDTVFSLENKCDVAGNPCNVTVNFGSNVNISSINQCSLQLIKEITDKLGIDKFQITSAVRSGADQARAMFNNIQRFGVAKQKSLYGLNGDSVIDAYSVALAAGKSNDEIKQVMLDKINEIGAYNVSNHSGNPNLLTVVDISPASIPLSNRSEFVNAINQAISNGEISKFLHPGNSSDPAYRNKCKKM